MKLSVENVKNTVSRAYEKASRGDVPQNCACKDLVDYVLDNTHLTYKYILVTALAAKATDETVNPLCLQVKSKLPGAYDARSICHGVIVRFDMEVLNKALGGSNEPFLNKPARFPELSTSNAVRKGRDQSILNILPYEDGAFLQAYRWLYQTEDIKPASIKGRCQVWHPYESIASRFMYRLLDYGYTKYPSIQEAENAII